jgi:hypothetical protein
MRRIATWDLVSDTDGFADQLARSQRNFAKIQRAAWETSRQYDVPTMVDRYIQSLKMPKEGMGPTGNYRNWSSGSHPRCLMYIAVSGLVAQAFISSRPNDDDAELRLYNAHDRPVIRKRFAATRRIAF